MKNYRFLYVFTILFLIIINIVAVIKIKKSKENLRKAFEQLTKFEETIEFLSNTIRRRDSLSFITENIQLNSNTLVTTLNNKSINLNQILDKTPKLVFKFSDRSCFPCVEMEIERLKKVAEVIGKKNILLLASYGNIRHLIFLKQQKNIGLSIYNVNDEHLSLPRVMKNTPFLFILDTTENAKLLFIPEKAIPELSEQYYHIVKKCYFE